MKRSEVWLVDLPAPIGKRPVLLLSRKSAYPVRTSITVAVITRTMRGIPTEVILNERDGMLAQCVVNLDDAKECIGKASGHSFQRENDSSESGYYVCIRD